MTILEGSLFLRGVRIYSLVNILLSAALAFFSHPRLSTPLFEFSLLGILHLFVLGGVLPLLMIRWFSVSALLRMGLAFTQVGAWVLVAGFFIHPRSALPLEGGILVSAGILLGILSLSWRDRAFRFWVFLWVSAVFGVFLGGVLARPTVDPIPFSAIAIHAMLGAGLGLFALGWTVARKKRHRWWEGGSMVLLALGIGEALQTTLISRMLAFLAVGALVVLLEGVGGKGRFLAIFLTGACLEGAWSGWLLPGEWISALAGSLVLGGLAGILREARLRPSPPSTLFP